MTLPATYARCPHCGAQVWVQRCEQDELVVCQACLCAWWVLVEDDAVTLRELENAPENAQDGSGEEIAL